ncbi:hypothetical protein C8Q78DRAFT_99615 [Trametes maxima]|nr:hypothetical protein C8Q78DRAFT_99615 [Trametes maxima]
MHRHQLRPLIHPQRAPVMLAPRQWPRPSIQDAYAYASRPTSTPPNHSRSLTAARANHAYGRTWHPILHAQRHISTDALYGLHRARSGADRRNTAKERSIAISGGRDVWREVSRGRSGSVLRGGGT